MAALRHHRRRQDHIARLREAWEAGKAVFGKDRIRLVLARPRIVPTQKDTDVIKARATAAMKAIDNRCMKSQKPGYGGRVKHNELLARDLIDKLPGVYAGNGRFVGVTGAEFNAAWASVDRVNSEGDHVVGNIRWMHRGLNHFKNESLDDRLIHQWLEAAVAVAAEVKAAIEWDKKVFVPATFKHSAPDQALCRRRRRLARRPLVALRLTLFHRRRRRLARRPLVAPEVALSLRSLLARCLAAAAPLLKGLRVWRSTRFDDEAGDFGDSYTLHKFLSRFPPSQTKSYGEETKIWIVLPENWAMVKRATLSEQTTIKAVPRPTAPFTAA